MSKLQRQYNLKDWELREDYYRVQLENIQLPDEPLPVDIKTIEHQLDKLFTEARIDHAQCKTDMERIDRLFKLAHKEAFLIVKDQGKTEKEREALAAQQVKGINGPGMNVDLYTAMDIAERRYIYMDAVLDVLKTKHERCITDSGVMKLEEKFLQQ